MSNTDLPEKEKIPADDLAQDEQKLDRLKAIAQARALRREAAALEEDAKAQITETAATILESAEPAPPKVPQRQPAELTPVSNSTGKFGWLDEITKNDAPPADTDALVDAILAESAAKKALNPADDVNDTAPDSAEAPLPELPAEETAAPAADTADDIHSVTVELSDDEPDEADEPVQTEHTAAPVLSAEPEQTAVADLPAAAAAAEPAVPADTAAPAEPEHSPEEQVIRELRHMTGKAPAMSDAEAAAQYRELTQAEKPLLRRQMKKNLRRWKKEAGSIRADLTQQRTQRTAAKWNIAVCLVMLFGTAAAALLLERPTVSYKENRTLAKMPEFSVESYLSGKYTSGVAEHYNDTVPFRDSFKELTQQFRKHMGLSGGPVIIGGMPAAQPNPAETTPAETTAPAVTTQTGITDAALTTVSAVTTTTAAADEPPEREGELSQNILIVDKRGIMLFGGWESMGEAYANVLNRFKESAPEINMYNMTVPTVCSFYTPKEFQHLITSEKANIDYINNHLVGVEGVDVYSALEKHKDEKIFMRTDHHWSSLGAFYAAEAFSASARVPFARIEEYDRYSKDDYVGTLYGFSGNIILKENPEEFFWYVPKAPFRTTYYTNSYTGGYEASFFMNLDNTAPVSYYMVYMSGDDHIVKLDTEMHNGRKLCVIKDSYGNALIPWLTSSFEEIYVIDMRYFKLNAISFLREHGITDVLFAMNSFSANGDNGLKIDTIRTQ